MRRLMIIILLCYPANAFCQPPSPEIKTEMKGKVWKKDPFVPPVVESGTIVREDLSSIVVSAILYSGEHSSALINGKTVHIGDELEGYKILDIKKTYVILGSGKKSYRLELKK